MMALSIIGIIWVQIIWITNAVKIQNESFNNAVSISLNNVATAIESARKMNLFNTYMLNDQSFLNNTPSGNGSNLNINSYSSEPGDILSLSVTNQLVTKNLNKDTITRENKSFVINNDTSIVTDSVSLVVSSPDGSGKMRILKRGMSANSKSGSVYINQNEFLDWVNKKSSEFRNMSTQMIAEIYQWEKTLEPENKDIENNLKQSLSFAGIHTPYKYALIVNGIVQDRNFKESQKNDFLKSNYMVRLFPGNIIRQDLILSVVFPERTNYVLGSMVWILGGSLLFSLFILSTFVLSLYFIIRQKKISEMKSDFINNMTHEFKTPIATISLAADTITNPKVINDEKSIRHFISMIKKENSRMNKKVETILQIASLDKKEIEFKFENLSIHTIIEHAIETIDIQVQQRNGRINLNLEASEPMVLGDSEHLVNLVSNLLDNAIKYSPESPEIFVSTKNCEKGIILSVED